jgi:VCBS repeat-containing protein
MESRPAEIAVPLGRVASKLHRRDNPCRRPFEQLIKAPNQRVSLQPSIRPSWLARLFAIAAKGARAPLLALATILSLTAVSEGAGFRPFVVNDAATVPRGGTVAVLNSGQASVLANDFDLEGDPLTAQLTRAPQRGTVTLNADGTFLYRHNGSNQNSDTFRYRAFDGTSLSQEAEVRISITAANVAPQIVGQRDLSTPEDQPIQIVLQDLTVEDSDDDYPKGFSLLLGAGQNYTLNGATVQPLGNFNGTLTVPTRVNDGQSDSDVFPLSIRVAAVNDPPVVVQAVVEQQAVEGEPFVLELGPSFGDPDVGDVLRFTATGLPASGSLAVDPVSGRLSGTPQEIDTLNLSYAVSVTATDTGGASVSLPFGLRVLPRRFDLSIAVDVAPSPATFSASLQWSLTVANASGSTSDPATLLARWYSSEAEMSISTPAGCQLINNLSFTPEVECQISALPPNAMTVLRMQSSQTAPGDETVIATLATSDANSLNDAAAGGLSLAGSFNAAPAQRLTGPGAAVGLADLDRDGASDLAAVSDRLRVYLNTGDKSFAATAASPAGNSAGEVLAFIDWNRDGAADIAVLRATNAAGRVFLNDGAGGFAAGPSLPVFRASAAAVIDIDQDGFAELAISGPSGTGIVGPTRAFSIVDARPAKDNVAADFNGDGRADIAVALTQTGAIAILETGAGGQFTVRTLTGHGSIAGLGAGDLSGDGAPDLLLAVDAATYEAPRNVVLRNELNGSFAVLTTFGVTDTKKLLAGDVNGDGYSDVVALNASGVHQVYFGGAQPALQLQPEFILAQGTMTGALADFDGDERPDLVLAGATVPNIDVLRNNGIGRFGPGDVTPPVIQLLGAPSVSIAAASTYRDAGATASDDVSGDLTAQIVVSNPVDTALVGTYQVSYNVSDLAGNPSPTMTRTVTVEAATDGGGGGGSIGFWGVAALGWLALRGRRRRSLNPARD